MSATILRAQPPVTMQLERSHMFDKLKQLKARMKEDRGATDPILVIASIAVTLALLVGGSFAVAQMITNANNLNAKGDLDKVSVAEASYFAENEAYSAYNNVTDKALENSTSIGFSPSASKMATPVLVVITNTGANQWAAISKSQGNGNTRYIRTSAGSGIYELTAAGTAFIAKDQAKGDAAMAAAGVTIAQLTAVVGK